MSNFPGIFIPAIFIQVYLSVLVVVLRFPCFVFAIGRRVLFHGTNERRPFVAGDPGTSERSGAEKKKNAISWARARRKNGTAERRVTNDGSLDKGTAITMEQRRDNRAH